MGPPGPPGSIGNPGSPGQSGTPVRQLIMFRKYIIS